MPYGACDVNDSYCFGRLPGALEEEDTDLLAFDSGGNIYRYIIIFIRGILERALH